MKNFTKYFAILSIFCVCVLTSCMDLFDEHETSLYGTITFDGNGGTTAGGASSYTQTFRKGEDFNLSGFQFVNPPRDDKSFVGWSRLSTAETYDFTDAQKMSSFSDLTLYAVWVEVTTGLYVKSGGTKFGPGDEAHPFGTIEQAIQAIYNTDNADKLDWTIYIDGTVTGTNDINKSLKAKSLTITKKEGTDGILDGDSLGSVVKIDLQGASTEVIFKDITIQNGSAANGGGIYIENSNVILESGATVSNNTATTNNGGGIYLKSGTLTMKTGSSVSNNTATGLGGGIRIDTSGILILNDGCSITGNTAGWGGGIYNDNSTTISNTCVTANTPNNIVNNHGN